MARTTSKLEVSRHIIWFRGSTCFFLQVSTTTMWHWVNSKSWFVCFRVLWKVWPWSFHIHPLVRESAAPTWLRCEVMAHLPHSLPPFLSAQCYNTNQHTIIGTMERVVSEGQVATAATYAHMFSSLPNCGKPTRLMVYDLHTLQNRFYLVGEVLYWS